MARTTDPRSTDPRSAPPTPRSPDIPADPAADPAARSPQLPAMPHARRVLSTLNPNAVPGAPPAPPVPEFNVDPLRAKRAPRQRRSAAYRRAQFLRHTLDLLRNVQRQLPPVDAVQPSRGRILSVFGVLLGAAIALEARLLWLQVVQHPELSQRARAQQQVRIKPFVPRRPIVDRNGTILALDRLTYTLYAHPKLFHIELNEVAQQLAPLLQRSPYDILQKLGQGRSGLRIADNLPESVATEIRALRLDGLDLQPGTSRTYPQQDLFADIVGYVNVDLQGQAGVEYQMQDLLERSGDWITLGRTPTGMKLLDLTPEPSDAQSPPAQPDTSAETAASNPETPSPEGSSPEGSSPEGSSPEGSRAEGSSPEGSSPEGSSPEGSGSEGSGLENANQGSATSDPERPGAITPGAATPSATPTESRSASETPAGERSRDRPQDRPQPGTQPGTQQRSTLPYTDDLRLQLTFDARIQRTARTALRQQMEAFKAKKGTVIVMDAQTGGLLALASEPTYDPNRFYEADVARFKNWAVAELQEPGSTFKPINVAIALESGAIRPEDTFNDTGAIRMGPDVIRNADFRQVGARGQIGLRDIMRTSSNVGMVRLIQKMDPLVYHDWLQKLGIGRTSGTDLPFEVASQMRSRERFRQVPIEVATTAFGQGLAVTPLQLTRLAATLANDGYLVVPHTIAGLVSADGQRYWKPYRPEPVRVFSQSTTRAVLEMMEAVVSDGTGKRAQIAQYRIAGKTGTSEKIGQDGRYSKALVTSFIGILTVDRPRYVVLAMFDEPQGGSGGLVAAPVVKEVMEAVIAIEQIPPAPAASP